MDLCVMTEKEANEQVLRFMDILRLPEWVKDAYNDGVYCATYGDTMPPVSGTIDKNSILCAETDRYKNTISKISVEGDKPFYYVVGQNGRTNVCFALTIPTEIEGIRVWEDMEREMRDEHIVRVFVFENGEPAQRFAFPLRYVPMNVNMGGTDCSSLRLELLSAEEYARMDIDLG